MKKKKENVVAWEDEIKEHGDKGENEKMRAAPESMPRPYSHCVTHSPCFLFYHLLLVGYGTHSGRSLAEGLF